MWQTVLVFIIVAAAAVYLVRRFTRSLGKGAVSCGCGGSCDCHAESGSPECAGCAAIDLHASGPESGDAVNPVPREGVN